MLIWLKSALIRIWWYRFQLILVIISLILLWAIVGHISQVGRENFFAEFGNKERPFYLVNIAIALAAIGTAIFTWWRNVLSNRQVEVAQEQIRQQIRQTENLINQTAISQTQVDNQIRQTENLILQTQNAQRQIELQEELRLDSLYAKAVEFLKQENDLITRKGGLHILKDLAVTSNKHTQKCIDMMCSLNEIWMPEMIEKNKSFFKQKYWTNYLMSSDELQEFVYTSNDLISLSQTVIKHLESIIEFIDLDLEFLGPYDLSYKYLCSIKLENVNLKKFKTNNIILCGAEILSSQLNINSFSNSDFYGATITDTNFEKANLDSCNFQQSIIKNCNFTSADLSSTYFQSSQIQKSKFTKAIIISSNLSYSRIRDCNFEKADLELTEFNGVAMKSSNLRDSNLESSSFKFAKLNALNLNGANISNSNFEFTTLIECFFNGSNLNNSIFQGSQMHFVTFNATNLSNSQLQGSVIRKTKFIGAILLNSSFYGSKIEIEKQYTILFNDWEMKSQIFDMNSDDFSNYIKNFITLNFSIRESHLIKEYGNFVKDLESTAILAYNTYKNNGAILISQIFNVISKPNKQFLDELNSISDDFSVAKGIMKFFTTDSLEVEYFEEIKKSVLSYYKISYPNKFSILKAMKDNVETYNTDLPF